MQCWVRGAGSTIDNFVDGLSSTNNYGVVNLGQLKNVGKLYYV